MKRSTVGSIVGAIVFLVVLSGVILFSTALSRSFTNAGAYSQFEALAEGAVILDAGTLDEEYDTPYEDAIGMPDDGSDEDPKTDSEQEEEQGGEEPKTDLNESISDEATDQPIDEPMDESADEQTDELTEEPKREEADGSNDSPAQDDIPGPRQYPPENDGDFYFAFFDIRTENDVKAQVEGLILRFAGSIDSIDPALLTDVVLTKDGVAVETSLSLTARKDQYQFQYRDITDFYFAFNDDVVEPGIYGLTGRYNGEWFKVYNKIIEEPISDTPADPSELKNVGWCFYPGRDEKPIRVSELVFAFDGKQNKFYQDDLTELVITRNGEEVPFSFMDHVFRYFEYSEWSNSGDTSFNLVLNQEFTESGTYVAKGVYRGVPFTSMEITIP